MTIVTEYRWKCDYCGNVSPVLSWADGIDGERVPPLGWVWKAKPLPEFDATIERVAEHWHFCTRAHAIAWMLEREGVEA